MSKIVKIEILAESWKKDRKLAQQLDKHLKELKSMKVIILTVIEAE